MADTTNYQCPHCMGPLHFNTRSGKLECEYCGSKFNPIEVKRIDQKATQETAPQQEEEAAEAAEAWGEDAEKMRAYSCSSCGAQLICEMNTAATSCPYCGNPTIIPGRFSGVLRPDCVIPFKLTKKDAEAALKRHYRKRLLLPRVFAEQNHIEEIKGIYVPFWLFDLESNGDITFHGSHSNTHREGNYQVTNTRHYALDRKGTIAFERIPVDGSKKMPDALMDSLEPYKYEDLVPFTTAYLPGFLADKYDVAAQESYNRAMSRSTSSTVQELQKTVQGYSDVRITSQNIDIQQKKMEYALLPVWLLTTKWKDETYLFAMNGQTGKMVGDLPVDPIKKAILFWGTLAGCALLSSLTIAGQVGRLLWALIMAILF